MASRDSVDAILDDCTLGPGAYLAKWGLDVGEDPDDSDRVTRMCVHLVGRAIGRARGLGATRPERRGDDVDDEGGTTYERMLDEVDGELVGALTELHEILLALADAREAASFALREARDANDRLEGLRDALAARAWGEGGDGDA